MLRAHPELRERVRLVQVAVPSRENVEAYREYREEVDALVGRIHGEFATPSWSPIHYLYRGLSQDEIVALYRAADAVLVTPLRDGMNLVAKEFVASRPDGDGVLVLSEFAGAAAELAEALLVNPYDVQQTAAAFHRALTMPEDERRTRMAALRERVIRYDVHGWARSFVARLEAVGAPGEALAPSSPQALGTPSSGSGRRRARAAPRLRRHPRALRADAGARRAGRRAPRPRAPARLAPADAGGRRERANARDPAALARRAPDRPPRGARVLVARAGRGVDRRRGARRPLARAGPRHPAGVRGADAGIGRRGEDRRAWRGTSGARIRSTARRRRRS